MPQRVLGWGCPHAVGTGPALRVPRASAGCEWRCWGGQGRVAAITSAVRLQVPLRQDYGTKVNLFSHLHQYSRKKPLTQQMRYAAAPAPGSRLALPQLAWLQNGPREGMSWSCVGDRLRGVEGGTLPLTGVGCPARGARGSRPRAVRGHQRRGWGVRLTPQATEQVGAGWTAPFFGHPSGCSAGSLAPGWLFLGCSADSSLAFVPAASPPRSFTRLSCASASSTPRASSTAPTPVASPCWKSSNRYASSYPWPPGSKGIAPGAGIPACPLTGAVPVLGHLQPLPSDRAGPCCSPGLALMQI